MIRSIQQGLAADGITVPVTKLCRWFDVPRRTVYYQPIKSTPKVDPVFRWIGVTAQNPIRA